MTDILKTVSKSKTTPTKAYQSSFSTTSTTFVDVTGLSLSVPNNSYYCIRGILSNDSNGGTASLQVLQGPTVVFSDSVSSNAPTVASKTTDSLILQNTSGSTQTVKVQIHISSTPSAHAIVSTMSIIEGVFVIPLGSQEIICDITSIDFISALGDGTSYVSYDGVIILDSVNTAVTYNTLEKLINAIQFTSNGSGYVAFDWAGKSIVTI